MSLGPGDVSCARVCTCIALVVDQTPSGEVSWVECVSIVVQCMPCAHACQGWCVCGLASTSRNSHAKEGSEPLQGVRPGERVHVSGCAWGAMRDVNPCAHRRRKRTKTEIGWAMEVARAAGWAGWTCRTMWSCNGSSQDRRWRGPHVRGLGRQSVAAE
jgi:hypothetical protein